ARLLTEAGTRRLARVRQLRRLHLRAEPALHPRHPCRAGTRTGRPMDRVPPGRYRSGLARMNLVFSCIGKRGYIADYFRPHLRPGEKIIGTSHTVWTPGFQSCDLGLVLPPIASDEY